MKKVYRVLKITERQIDDEFYTVLKKRTKRNYASVHSVNDDFETEKEAIEFGVEVYGWDEFTVIPIYSAE